MNKQDRERSTEIAERIVNQWANMEAGPLDIPAGRLWMLRQDIAEAIRHERARELKQRIETEKSAAAIDGLLIMLAQGDGDMDYNAIDRAFDALVAARQRNASLPLSIPVAFEVTHRMAGDPKSKTWREMCERALEHFERFKEMALTK